MEKTNVMLTEKHLPSILANAVPITKSAHNLYERNGWKLVLVDDKGWRWMAFNLPDEIDKEKLLQAINNLKKADPTYPTDEKL